MSESQFDLIVIGAGPGGYVAAIRGAQLGLNVACIEKEPALGGTCLRVGCIPSKALLESTERYHATHKELKKHGINVGEVSFDLGTMMGRKDKIVSQLTGGIAMLFKKNKVTHVAGHGRLKPAGEGQTPSVEVLDTDGQVTQTLSGTNVLLAAGSVPSTLPGLDFDGQRVGNSTDALAYPEVPETLVVVGAGVIGLELGSVWARLGSKVIVLEYMPKLLPMFDPEVGRTAGKLFKRQGLDIRLGVKVQKAVTQEDGGSAQVEYLDAKGETQTLSCDRVLVAVGRRAASEAMQLAEAGVALDERGRVVVDETFRTAVPGVWAIGDLIAGPMLAHKAEEEGVAAVEAMCGMTPHINYDAIPNIIYTHPEIASIGPSSEQLKKAGIPVKAGSFPFAANGRAKALAETDGMVKILAHAETDRILGAQIIGARAGDLIAELALAAEFSASSEDLARSVHAHPTLAEVVKEAALAVDERAVHI